MGAPTSPTTSAIAAAVAGAPDRQLQESLRRLRDSLRGFRDDVDNLHNIRRRHTAHLRQAVQSHSSTASASEPSAGKAESPAIKGPVRDLWSSLAVDVQGKSVKEAWLPQQARSSLEETPQVAAVGIGGVGRLAGDSPDSKSSRRELQLDKLGGEEQVRKLLGDFAAREAQERGAKAELTRESIQDMWIDKLSGDAARVSALYLRTLRPDAHANIDSRQFILSRGADGQWRVDCMLEPPAAAGVQPDECEVSQSADLPSPVSAEAPRPSPKRRAPPPLTEVAEETAGAPGEEDEAVESEALAEAVRFGLGIAERSSTPRQVFQNFATPQGSTSVIQLQRFAALVSTYSGRTPSTPQAGESLSSDLFDELAVGEGDDRGVPYDLFCAELCPETAPDAVIRVKGKRVALLRDLRAAVVEQFGSSPTGAGMPRRMSALSGFLKASCGGGDSLKDSEFVTAVNRLLGCPPASAPDLVAVKALWCDQVRGKKGDNRLLSTEALCKVLLEPEGGGMTPMGPASHSLSRLSPSHRTTAKPLDVDLLTQPQHSSSSTTVAPVDVSTPAFVGTLLEALRFTLAAQGQPLKEVFASAASSETQSGSPPCPLSHAEFAKLAAKYGGGVPLGGVEDEDASQGMSTDAEAAALFEELATPPNVPLGERRLSYEIFVAEVCPERAPEDATKVGKSRRALFRDLQRSVMSAMAQAPGRPPPALSSSEPLNEVGFGRVVRELLVNNPPDELVIKALWCQLMRDRRKADRKAYPRELMALMSSSPSPTGASKGLHHMGSLELSDDENSEFELSLSASVPGPDAVIEDVTPFATPTGGRPVVKTSLDGIASLLPVPGKEEQVPPASPPASPLPTIQVVPPSQSGPAGGALAGALMEAAAARVSLAVSPEPKELVVTIVSARGLRDADWLPGGGKSDPYCVCEIKGKPNSRFQTMVEKNELNPVWNRDEIVEDYEVGDSLEFTVFDQDEGKKHDVLGRLTLKKEQFHPNGFDGELPLEEAGKGIKAFLKVKVSPYGTDSHKQTEIVPTSTESFWATVTAGPKADQDPPLPPPSLTPSPANSDLPGDRFSIGPKTDEATAYASVVASAAVAAAVAEASVIVQNTNGIKAKPGDEIVGEYDRKDIHRRHAERLGKQEGDGELREKARSSFMCATMDGRLKQAVADGTTSPAKEDLTTRLDRPGATLVEPLSSAVLAEKDDITKLVSPASASMLDSTVTEMDDSVAGLLKFGALPESLLDPTKASPKASPKALTKEPTPEETTSGTPPGQGSSRNHLFRHSVSSRSSLSGEPHEVKLYQIRKMNGNMVEREVPLTRESLNQGDSFVLDTEETVYVWHGDASQPTEKYQATTLADKLLKERGVTKAARHKVSHEVDGNFWVHLGGEGPIKKANEVTDSPPTSPSIRRQSAQVARRKFEGKSPFMSSREMDKVFDEADADQDGFLSLDEMLAYLGDYLRYGDAEVKAFHGVHSAGIGVTRDLLKKHYMELNPYELVQLNNRLVVRKPGAFGGLNSKVKFSVEECKDSTVLICERTAEVHVDQLTNCRVLVGPCASSVFIRNCTGCDFWVATKQFRTRECTDCRIYLYCKTEPVIEMSSGLSIAPFSAEYPGLTAHFKEADFDPLKNRWKAVYDFSGKAGSANWRIQPLDECETLVVSFKREAEKPDNPCPALTQEMLLADPPPSEESTGHSLGSIPQTRPPPPPAPQRRHPVTSELLERPRRRLVHDGDEQLLEGTEDLKGEAHPWHSSQLPLPRGADEPVRAGRPSQRGRGASSSSDDGPVQPQTRGRAKAAARAANQSSSSSSDEASAPKTRLLGSAMAQNALQALMAKQRGRAEEEDSDD